MLDGCPQDGPFDAAHEEGTPPTGQVAGVLDGSDGADPGVAAIDSWDEEQPAPVGEGGVGRGPGVGRVEGDLDDHAGPDDAGFEGENGEGERSGVSHQRLQRRLHAYHSVPGVTPGQPPPRRPPARGSAHPCRPASP